MRIVVADEISPDSCRLWDIDTNEKMDKYRFRKGLGGLVEAYQEVADRLGINPEKRTAARQRTGSGVQQRWQGRKVTKARVTVTLKNGGA